jgi:hypothetical protein
MSQTPILLAGTYRCGSTWVANVIGRAPGVHNVYEPDSRLTDILGLVSSHRLGQYPALGVGQRSYWYSMVWDLAFAGGWPWSKSSSARRAGKGLLRVPTGVRDHGVAALARAVTILRAKPDRVLVKSANCALSLEWLAQRYRPRVVVQHRDPLNVISSWTSLNIAGDPSLAEQRAVRERWLTPLGLPTLPTSASDIARVAWTVGLLTTALKVTSERHPDWIVVSHDALCAAPDEGFPSLFGRLDLPWTVAAQAYLAATDDPSFVVTGANPRHHPNQATVTQAGQSRRLQQSSQYRRRLSEADVAEARAVLADFPLGTWGSEMHG